MEREREQDVLELPHHLLHFGRVRLGQLLQGPAPGLRKHGGERLADAVAIGAGQQEAQVARYVRYRTGILLGQGDEQTA